MTKGCYTHSVKDFKTWAGTCSSLRWFFSLQNWTEMKPPTCKNDTNLHFLVSHGELYFTLLSSCPSLKVKTTTQLPLHLWTDFFSFAQDFWSHFNSCVVLFQPSFSPSPLQRCSRLVHSAVCFFVLCLFGERLPQNNRLAAITPPFIRRRCAPILR